jgi:hypothetical protein
MLTSFIVERYRGLQNLELPGLGQFNLFTGMNGVGKTSLGEAFWLFHGRYNPPLLWNMHLHRTDRVGHDPLLKLGGSPVSLKGNEDGAWFRFSATYEEHGAPLLVPRPAPAASSSAEGERQEGSEQISAKRDALQLTTPMGRLVLEYEENGRSRTEMQDVVLHPVVGRMLMPGVQKTISRPSGVFLASALPRAPVGDTVERMSRVIQAGHKDKLIDFLRLVHPSVKNIELITEQEVPSILADIGLGWLPPLEALGGGAVRALILFVNIHVAQRGILVVDEIDNGFHHQVLPALWSQVFELCQRFDVQLFATTHSLECVRAAVQASKQVSKRGVKGSRKIPDLWIHKLYRIKELVRIESYSKAKLESALELELELR